MTRRMRRSGVLGASVLALGLGGLAGLPTVAAGQTRVPGVRMIPPRTPPHYPPYREVPDRTFCTATRELDLYFECRADGNWWVVTDEYWRCPPDAQVAVRKDEIHTGQPCVYRLTGLDDDLRPPPDLHSVVVHSQELIMGRSILREAEYIVTLVCVAGTWHRRYQQVNRSPDGRIAYLTFVQLSEDTRLPCLYTHERERPNAFTIGEGAGGTDRKGGMSTGTKVGLGAAGVGAVGLGLALRGGSSTPAPSPTPTPTPPPFNPAGTYTCAVTVASDLGNFAQFIQLAPNPPLTVSMGPPFAISGPSGSNWATVSGPYETASGAFNLTGTGASGTTAVFQGTLRAPGAIEGNYTVSHPNWQTTVVYRVVCQKQ